MSAIESNVAGRRIWHFAGCALDERELQLRVRGRLVGLERKPAQLLLHLLKHAGERVSKSALLDAIWPDRFVSEASLTKAMALLRGALGPAAAGAIRTEHGYGYRLVARVRVEVDAPDPAIQELVSMTAEQIERRYQDQPARAGELHRLLGSLCLRLGLHRQARHAMERADVLSAQATGAGAVAAPVRAAAQEFATG